jgi:hypothetical protein
MISWPFKMPPMIKPMITSTIDISTRVKPLLREPALIGIVRSPKIATTSQGP